jgi:hypothetical protein
MPFVCMIDAMALQLSVTPRKTLARIYEPSK